MNEQIKTWPKQPINIIQAFEQRGKDRGPVGALVHWATISVESLYYLDELDDVYNENLCGRTTYRPEVVDITHSRWTAVTAISSLDLCAAALGREYCNSKPVRELDLRGLDPNRNKNNYTKLPLSARGWIDGVVSDHRYLDIHSFRNPLTHSRLFRSHFLGAS